MDHSKIIDTFDTHQTPQISSHHGNLQLKIYVGSQEHTLPETVSVPMRVYLAAEGGFLFDSSLAPPLLGHIHGLGPFRVWPVQHLA